MKYYYLAFGFSVVLVDLSLCMSGLEFSVGSTYGIYGLLAAAGAVLFRVEILITRNDRFHLRVGVWGLRILYSVLFGLIVGGPMYVVCVHNFLESRGTLDIQRKELFWNGHIDFVSNEGAEGFGPSSQSFLTLDSSNAIKHGNGHVLYDDGETLRLQCLYFYGSPVGEWRMYYANGSLAAILDVGFDVTDDAGPQRIQAFDEMGVPISNNDRAAQVAEDILSGKNIGE